MIYLALLGCVFFILLQGFFAASEIGFISSSLLKLRHRRDKGQKGADKAYNLISRPEKFLITTLVGTNISVVLSSSFITFFLIKLGVKNSNVWITLLFTPIVVIFAELIPKNIGRYFRESFSCSTANLIIFFERLFLPIVKSIEFVIKLLIRLIAGKSVKARSPFVTKEEIRLLIKEIEKEGGIDRGEKEAIEEVFELQQDKIKDVSMSLKKIVGVDYADSRDKILEVVNKSGFTRYPVFKNKEIIGYINIFDLFYNPDVKWDSLIRPITKVGVSQKIYEVLTTLKAKKESMALVYKGKRVYGIVTVQDLIRELISSIIKI